jgi:hypothetical protein
MTIAVITKGMHQRVTKALRRRRWRNRALLKAVLSVIVRI